LPIQVERALSKLIELELSLAGQSEILKQELTSCFDFNVDLLYREIDDCGFKFVDTCGLNRFLHKCGIAESQSRVVAIIRRLDLDADARLSFNEFNEAVTPQEAFTKKSTKIFRKQLTAPLKKQRPTTAHFFSSKPLLKL
jgi:hypothetical protein